MELPCTRLFVYGTLRRGYPHPMADFLAEKGRWLGRGQVPGRLHDLGPYPGLLGPLTERDWVTGDLYELPRFEETLSALDRYEGACLRDDPPCLFKRIKTFVRLDSGEEAAAWVYEYRGTVAEEKRIASGDYLDRA